MAQPSRIRQPATSSSTASGLARVPPQDIEAEMALLGSMLIERDVIGAVLEILARQEDDLFYRDDHRALFCILIDLYDRGQPIDIRLILDQLARRGELEQVGGSEYLAELVESVPSAANAEHYARIVRDKGLLRRLISCNEHIRDTAYAAQDDVSELLDEAERQFFQVTEQRITNRPDLIKNHLIEAFERIQSRDGSMITGLSTGFLELDDLTTGLQNGEMIVVAARPSMGKTALGLNLAEHMAVDERKPVVFFSMEMGKQQLVQRIICSRARVDSRKLRRGSLSEREIARVSQICGELEDAPLYIDDTPGMTPLELRAKARRLAIKEDLAAVFVDYLQLMYVPRAESRQAEISEISRGLKGLARDLNVPVITLAQLNRGPEAREGHRPRMSDLRESGAIEQDADVVALLHRADYFMSEEQKKNSDKIGVTEIIIAKQRNGPTGAASLHFDSTCTRFDNLAVAPEPDYVPADNADTIMDDEFGSAPF